MNALNPPIFCCDTAVPVQCGVPTRLHNNPNRELHEAIFQSLVRFAVRTQKKADQKPVIQALFEEIIGTGTDSSDSTAAPDPIHPLFPQTLQPTIYVPGKIKNNPLTEKTAYVVHLTSRHDFGPVYSHRYLMCPTDLEDDWVELTHMEWFAEGKPFDMLVERWDLKCTQHSNFFRMALRPNLNLRDCPPVLMSTPITPLVGKVDNRSPPLLNMKIHSPGLVGGLTVGSDGIQASARAYVKVASHRSIGTLMAGTPASSEHVHYPYQVPRNSEKDHFTGCYLTNEDPVEYRGLSTGISGPSYGNAVITEDSSSWVEYPAESWQLFGEHGLVTMTNVKETGTLLVSMQNLVLSGERLPRLK